MTNISEIFNRYLEGRCSKEELKLLLRHFRQEQPDKEILDRIDLELGKRDSPEHTESQFREIVERNRLKLRSALRTDFTGTSRKKARIRYWYAAAAIVLLLLAGGLWQNSSRQHEAQSLPLVSQYGEDALPGGNRAVLTLSDGQTIDLNSTSNGMLAEQGGIIVSKDAEGTISYEIRGNDNGKPAYNSIRTPRGGQYKIILPDGSKVWLNAASALKYPTRFTGNGRLVELSGEAFFDVTHDEDRPFIVQSDRHTVEVLGTEFNIKTYDNEPTASTTLVAGSVLVRETESNKAQMLKPGQQASLSPRSIEVRDVSVEEYIAWKNGDFIFQETPLSEILRILERWYDIEVDYRHIPARTLSAAISRDKKLSSVLYMIEQATGLVFILKERRLSLQTKAQE